MRITTKGFYAVEMLRALAMWKKSLPMTLADIEDTLHIPRHYAERILLHLKRVGIAHSMRGNAGGWRLARKSGAITLSDIFHAVGEDITPWDDRPPRRAKKRPLMCPMHPVWQKLYRQNIAFFENTKLADFL